MNDFGSIHLRRLQARLGGIAYELMRVPQTTYRPRQTWCPATNVYQCREKIVVCVELAGVSKSLIDIRVEPHRILIRGQRQAPVLDQTHGPLTQVLALEMDEGPFERELLISARVEPDQVTAEQREGILWIHVPLATGQSE